MDSRVCRWLVLMWVLGQVCTIPVQFLETESRPLALVSDLGKRLVSHSRFQDYSAGSASGDPRLGLPSPQELEAIKKVAQILIMLGEQVIPAIIGDSSPPLAHGNNNVPVDNSPNDPVNEN